MPFGDYSITEDIPQGEVLNIFCTEALPPGSTADNDTGELSFSITSPGFNINCLFINVTAQTLLKATEEPAGSNCIEGGVRIDSGLDTDLNGVLDPEEVLNTYYVCNGETGAVGPQGPQGPPGSAGPGLNIFEEPPGENCEFGGIRIEVGTDENENEQLDPDEVEDTFYVCNGAPGSQGAPGPPGEDSNSGCGSLSPASSISGTSVFTGLIVYHLIPALIALRRRFCKV